MTLQFRPLTSTFGAEVLGFDVSQIGNAVAQADLQRAFANYRILLFRDIDLNAEQQARLGSMFGTHAPPPEIPGGPKPAEANTQYVSNNRADGMLPIGDLAYHQDHLFDANPVRAIMLYGVEIPSSGSKNRFRSCKDMYTHLDPETRKKADKVSCLHLFDFMSAGESLVAAEDFAYAKMEEKKVIFSLEKAAPQAPRTWQPLVWHDPLDGDPALWCNYQDTVAFEGVSHEDGMRLLDEIIDTAQTVEEYVHDWRKGDAVIWNNLHLQHARMPFNPKEPRTLRRTTLM